MQPISSFFIPTDQDRDALVHHRYSDQSTARHLQLAANLDRRGQAYELQIIFSKESAMVINFG